MNSIQTLILDGKEYVVVPMEEWNRRTKTNEVRRRTSARDAVRTSIASDLKKARESAGLTQVQLARKLKKSQAMISGAENGSIAVGWTYACAVLKACGLPETWTAHPQSDKDLT